ncbi:MAG TPA: AlkA N-terminal domain-containing protein [Gemmatimonadales bacterium]|nr:AlkA N-terminal domain-containing protein [Gemmatimonadales bacterium]
MIRPLSALIHDTRLRPDVCERALDARDPRFDGVFFVGITTTGIYCRPVCPARVSHTERRRFFDTAASAERAGFRPCLRCRPELAPGRAVMDAVSRLASTAAQRIAGGALNGRGVAELSAELGVSARHLRRALERELGVTPVELAQTHRLLLAKQLLTDTPLPVTRIAFASGFQSLRRFNSAFRERYRLSPSALRKSPRAGWRRAAQRPGPDGDCVSLTLSYRAPLAWNALLGALGQEALPEIELRRDGRYLRTVSLEERTGVVIVDDAGSDPQPATGRTRSQLVVGISLSLLPVLMPLLARLRHLFDLDAEPNLVDAHLAQTGLAPLVRSQPGLRIPGAMDGFEAAFRVLLHGPEVPPDAARRVVEALGEPADTGIPGLSRRVPTAARVAAAGADGLASLGLPRRPAEALSRVAQLVEDGGLRLEPGSDLVATRQTLMGIPGVGDRLATAIVQRALYWPDAFAPSDPALRRAAGCTSAVALRALAERWRPWRAYAAQHLRLAGAGAPELRALSHAG